MLQLHSTSKTKTVQAAFRMLGRLPSDPRQKYRLLSLLKGRRLQDHWRLHPQAEYFLSRGGRQVPPPFVCNLALTNRCNLRCEICGSQKHLDAHGIRRSDMDPAVFRAVAETIFPLMTQVELNSQGEPLLYSHIEEVLAAIAAHGCDIKLTTNGTVFTGRTLDLLLEQCGTVMISLDAVGPLFDEARRGGKWVQAEPQIARLLRERDPRRLKIGLYPTLTRRTTPGVMDLVRWSHEHQVDEIAFHRYQPVLGSVEEVPSDAELAQARSDMRAWLAGRQTAPLITLDGTALNAPPRRPSRTQYANPAKHALVLGHESSMVPTDETLPDADPTHICLAPFRYLEIGLLGQISACCRSQNVVLGRATSVAEFADAWLGQAYAKVRDSLRRDAEGPYALQNCEACIRYHCAHPPDRTGSIRATWVGAGAGESGEAWNLTPSRAGRTLAPDSPPGASQQRASTD